MSEAMAITMYDRIENPMTAVTEMGNFLAKSGMFGCEKAEQGMVLAMACMCEKKSPLEILKTYHIIAGRLAMRADAMLAGFRQAGGKVTWKKFDETAAIASWTYDNNKDIEISYTAEDARKAGYLPAKPGSGWHKNPDAMLRARCVSKALRMLAPEVVAGTFTPEEVADFDLKPVAGEVIQAQPTTAAAAEPETAKRSPGRPRKEPEVSTTQPAATSAAVEAPKQPKPTKAPQLSPAPPPPEPKAEPAPAAAAAVVDNPLHGKIEVVEIICSAGNVLLNGVEVPVTREQVVSYLRGNKMIGETQDLKDMDEKLMDRIAAKPDAFLRAVAAGVVPKK